MWVLSLAVLLSCDSSLLAQEYRGSIHGRIADSSGAVVAGAKVRVSNMETGVAVDTTSNEEGNYQAPFLLPGNYSVAVEHAGFKRAERGDIRVSTGTQVTVDLSLEVGSSSESVIVRGESPLLDTAAADLGQVLTSKVVTEVAASIYRNAANFVRLAPGVTGQSMGTYTSDDQTAVSITGGGGTQGSNEWIIDGVSNTVPLSSGSVVLVPPVDSIEELKVSTTMFDASYGHSNGGAVTIVTKGGTNELHWTVYLFKRWAALYANTWSNDRFG